MDPCLCFHGFLHLWELPCFVSQTRSYCPLWTRHPRDLPQLGFPSIVVVTLITCIQKINRFCICHLFWSNGLRLFQINDYTRRLHLWYTCFFLWRKHLLCFLRHHFPFLTDLALSGVEVQEPEFTWWRNRNRQVTHIANMDISDISDVSWSTQSTNTFSLATCIWDMPIVLSECRKL